MLGRLSVYIYIIADVFYAFSSLFGEEEKMIGQERTMTCQGYLVFHPLSSVKECQVRTNTLSFIILNLILIILPIVIILLFTLLILTILILLFILILLIVLILLLLMQSMKECQSGTNMLSLT